MQNAKCRMQNAPAFCIRHPALTFRIDMVTLLITGGAGFIGSNLVHYALDHTSDRIVIVDKLTYAGSLLSLERPLRDERVRFERADIADAAAMARVFAS